MRAYDLALVITRVSAGLLFVQAVVTAAFSCVRIVIAVIASSNLHVHNFIMISELSQFTFPMEEAGAAAAFLFFGKSLARFGAQAVSNPDGARP